MTAPSGTTSLDDAAELRADRRTTVSHDEDWRALLLPLSRAQDALARLETAAARASEAVRAGLVARLALHEAAGWLARNGTNVSATDLALRDAGLIGAWGIATYPGSGAARDDRLTGQALRLAQAWRELVDRGDGSRGVSVTSHSGAGEADHPDQDALRQALAALGGGPLADDVWLGWRALIDEDAANLPVLLRAARVAGRWQHERAAGKGRA